MYKMFPAPQPLPGTELVQRVMGNGLGSYYGTPTYWGTPAAQAGIRGLGCGGSCECAECQRGFSGLTMDGTGFLGTGLFVSADPTTWSAWEWGSLALGMWMLYSTLFTARRGARAVREGAGRVKSYPSRKAKSLRKKIARRIEGR